MSAKVILGEVVCTPNVLNTFDHGNFIDCLSRHIQGDWGDLCEEDKIYNDDALVSGQRLLSVYMIDGTKLWIITEADRSVTTLLLPNDY